MRDGRRFPFARLCGTLGLSGVLFACSNVFPSLPHWFEADRTRHRVEAVEFLARLHEAKGATRWE